MSAEVLLVLATFPSHDVAHQIGRAIVEEQLAACVNLLPQVESIYRWKGAVETASETLTFFKTTAAQYPALEARLRQLHPYEVPEIIALPLAHGSPDYLQWIAESVRP